MHSIMESDGVPSDPYEVLCHMAALIIEGRTPLHVSKGLGDCILSSETVLKPPKPYYEGPHCPNFMKLYNKEPATAHKCSENNGLCIRFGKLKQHLLHLYEKSVPITVEASLGPDCLCGELRSQSTLVSVTPSKRDIVLEQWTISLKTKRGHEPSQMSLMNLYQAVRSLLHFSQLTAWYTRNNGTKPAHVIYRVCVPKDSTFITDENFLTHHFPSADINKGISIKISIKSIPRMESIPTVYCPQHFCGHLEGAQDNNHQEGKDCSRLGKDKKYLGHGIGSALDMVEKEELSDDNLPLKFQGVRKKIYKDRKSKSRLNYFGSSPPYDVNTCRNDLCDGLEYFDAIASDKQTGKSKSGVGKYDCFGGGKPHPCDSLKNLTPEHSLADLAKGKAPQFPGEMLFKPRIDLESLDTYPCNVLDQKYPGSSMDLMTTLKSLKSDGDFDPRAGDKSDESPFKRLANQKLDGLVSEAAKTPARGSDIVDDRMQISCGISGKHHCKCEYEEEVDNLSLEKPRRRRSIGKTRPEDCGSPSSETDKILHGKFKEVDRGFFAANSEADESGFAKASQKPCTVTLKTIKRSIQNESSKWIASDLPIKKSFKSSSQISVAGEVSGEAEAGSAAPGEKAPDSPSDLDTDSSGSDEDPKMRSEAPLEKGKPKREDCMSFACRGAEREDKIVLGTDKMAATRGEEDGGERNSGGNPSNPFGAAKTRKAKKNRYPLPEEASRHEATQNTCDNSQNNLCNSDLDKKEEFESNNCDYAVDKNVVFLNKLKLAAPNDVPEEQSDTKAKVAVAEEFEHPRRQFAVPARPCRGMQSPTPAANRCKHRMNLDLKSERLKRSVVRNLSSLDTEEDFAPSEFLSKSLNRLKSLFDKRDAAAKGKEKPGDEGCRLELDADDAASGGFNGAKTIPVPSAQDKLNFRRSLDSAAQLVFHRCSGLPLTSSPAPVRRNNSSFSFDSSLNSVSAIKSALFDSANSISSEEENESEGSLRSPASPGTWSIGSKSINYHSLSPLPLLGTFEESVLNGRLEPVSTVQGFTAELGASGSFCTRHLHLPVTVFFYTLGDNDKVSAPYLGHINLGKKGYNVPRSGTVQVTLFNPLRTVVKMFVVVYDLNDMPPNSHTFLRQRTLYVPANQKESLRFEKSEKPFEQEDYHRYLRYLIHLRFVSGKTGRIYLHTDIRMVIFRKADEDTATALGKQVEGETFELRSHTHGPMNPKFSPRK